MVFMWLRTLRTSGLKSSKGPYICVDCKIHTDTPTPSNDLCVIVVKVMDVAESVTPAYPRRPSEPRRPAWTLFSQFFEIVQFFAVFRVFNLGFHGFHALRLKFWVLCYSLVKAASHLFGFICDEILSIILKKGVLVGTVDVRFAALLILFLF